MMVILTYQPLWLNSVSWWLEYTCTFSLRFDTRSYNVVGLYSLSWEFSISFAFDWSFITGARKFKWPMVRTWSFTHSLVCEVYLFRPRSSTSAIDICSWHAYVLCTWLKAFCHIHKSTDTSSEDVHSRALQGTFLHSSFSLRSQYSKLDKLLVNHCSLSCK